ncbi:MAG: hypothetical protein M0Q90_17075 [Bacteroidales bacterium]|nr:hypothetical protein [Bacteroidales bacterium]
MSKDKGKLIPKLRFPEFENENEWDQKSLGETGTIVTGKTPSTKDESLLCCNPNFYLFIFLFFSSLAFFQSLKWTILI